ncbi:NUDIX hydrolase [Saccharopolyspora sp. CA-218241]|uniref:NUDIX hydrolase n=1 Tax=Saccharopolyspora sp. CA-218241 TaxID=3240027 RepID=UPI003D974A2B
MVRRPENGSPPSGADATAPKHAPEPAEVAVPKDAATVVLLREGPRGPEVFLQRRVTGMAFAGGMTVFPGGGVDPRDADASVSWTGPDAGWWAHRFGCSAEQARALVCAAVRETFEESGVLLAGPDAGSVVADTAAYGTARAALISREVSLAAFLAAEGLVLRADLLRPWSNWLTPEAEPRRYDTRFFLAAMPGGQRADARTTEAAEAYWRTPAEALADADAGRSRLLPPTRTTLAEVDACGGIEAALAAERGIAKVLPKLVRVDDRWEVVLPGEPGYQEAR